MESPYYEMTHDFEEENRLFQSGYIKGYHDAMIKGTQEAVVRCKDCKWRNTKACFCKAPNDVQDDWFCSEGEKRK